MSCRITLICHAATVAMRRGIFPGDLLLDLPARPLPAAAAARLPAWDRAWTSPAEAARRTAQALGLAAVPTADLRDGDLGRWAGRSLAAIAAECGFTDQAHLARSFRAVTGQTPSSYRREFRALGAPSPEGRFPMQAPPARPPRITA